jgi:hypothetical protein
VLSYNVPEGTQGQVVLPCVSNGGFSSITCDGQPVKPVVNWGGQQQCGGSVAAQGGSHTYVVR